jgi:predicted Zn-dependent protease
MLNQLIDILENDDRVSGWQVRELAKRGTQLFLNKSMEEGRRTVEGLSFDVEILVTRKGPRGSGKDWVTGNARFNVDPGAVGRFRADLETALASANLVANEAYHMTEVGGQVPKVELADPALVADAEGQVAQAAQQLRAAAAKAKGVRLAAAEFFADRFRTRYFNSQGVNCLFESTLFSGEFCLLAKGKDGGETEVFKAFKRRRLQDVGLEAMVAQAAEQSVERLDAVLPESGQFDVVISGEALDHFFAWVLTQASGAAKYNRLTQAELGDALVETAAGATPLHLYSNALVPWAVGSYKVDMSGSLGCRRLLVENGRLKALQANSRYAQYLKVPAIGDLGNVEVLAGKESGAQLLKPEAGRPLYHLNDFSYFEPNGITGEFSTEIRFGRRIDAQGSRPVKGGSVSGLSRDALATARFSAEIEQRERYRGPQFIRLQGLSLAGD